MQLSRQLRRGLHRRVAEYAMMQTLGKGLPRRIRRLAGRAYGNAAWRVNAGLPTHRNKYTRFGCNRTLVGVVAAETAKLLLSINEPAERASS